MARSGKSVFVTAGEAMICEAIVEMAKARMCDTKKGSDFCLGRAWAYLHCANLLRNQRAAGFDSKLYNAIMAQLDKTLGGNIRIIADAGAIADWNMEERIIPILRSVQTTMRETMFNA